MPAEPSYRDEVEEDYSDEEPLSESEPSDECEDDRCRGPTPPVWHCVDCDSSYCRYVRANSEHAAHRLTSLLAANAGPFKALTNPRSAAEMAFRTRRLTPTLCEN